jgi:hypothetical protein
MQGLFKFVIGPEIQGWPWLEWNDAFDIFDLSEATVWGTREGKELLEAALAERLFDHRLLQSIQDTPRTIFQDIYENHSESGTATMAAL